MGISDLLETGANFIAGLLEGIVGGLKNIGTWIKENIFNPIVNWFKDLFGIHSPSTVFAEFGGYMMEGLKNGVNNAIEAVKKVVTKVWTTIKGVFSTVKTWFTNLFKGAWNGIKTAFSSVKTFFSGIWTKIKACFSAVKTWFSSLFSGAWEKIKNAFSSVKSFFSGIWTKIKGVFSSVGTWFKEKFTGAWDKIKEVFSLDNVKQFFSDVWEGVKGCFGKVSSWFSETFAGAWQGIKDIFSKGGEVFSGIVDGVADTFKSVVNTLIDGINAVIKTPFTKINGMLNTIHDVSIAGFQPFSGLWSKDPLPIPQIPKLAEGAVLPANKPFLAMLGDQKNGTNVETPLATMIEAFNTALDSRASSSGDIPQTIQLVLDMTGVKLLAECIWDEQEKKYKQTNSRESRVTRFT
jgi:phage-related protein